DLALLERDEEALLQDRPDEDAAADDDALAGIRFGGLAAGAAAHDDHRGVRRNALDASRHEAEDRERDDDEGDHGEDGDILADEVHGCVAFLGGVCGGQSADAAASSAS